MRLPSIIEQRFFDLNLFAQPTPVSLKFLGRIEGRGGEREGGVWNMRGMRNNSFGSTGFKLTFTSFHLSCLPFKTDETPPMLALLR